MKNILLILIIVLVAGCASTAPELVRYDFPDNEKRLIKINPIENKTGSPEYDKLVSTLTGKFINYVEKSGKYKVIVSSDNAKEALLKAPDSIATAALTKITFHDNSLFGLLAWINTPTVEVDMNLRISDIDTSEILSTSSVTEKAWEEEWVALFLFKLGNKKTQKQLEPIALDYALKSLVDKM